MPKTEVHWLNGTQLAALFNLTAMTIWRWERNRKLGFPKPTIISHRKYWSRDAIDQWMRDQATGADLGAEH